MAKNDFEWESYEDMRKRLEKEKKKDKDLNDQIRKQINNGEST